MLNLVQYQEPNLFNFLFSAGIYNQANKTGLKQTAQSIMKSRPQWDLTSIKFWSASRKDDARS